MRSSSTLSIALAMLFLSGLLTAQTAIRLDAGETYTIKCGCGETTGTLAMGSSNSFGEYEDNGEESGHEWPDSSNTLTSEGTDKSYFIGTLPKKVTFFDDGKWKMYDTQSGNEIGAGSYTKK